MPCQSLSAGIAASAIAAALAAGPSPIRAATFDWTGLALPNDVTSWSNPFNWSPILAPTGTAFADRLVFSQDEAEAENDVRDDFRLAFLGKTSGAGTVTLTGRSLRFAESQAEISVSGGTLSIGNELRGAASIVKTGNGSLLLSGDSADFTGEFTLVDGTLHVSSRRALGATGKINVLRGAHLVIGSATEFTEIAGAGRISMLASTTVTLAGDSAFLGTLDGTGGLGKRGIGTFTMFGRSTAAGRTDVLEGRFELSGRDARWAGAGLEVGAGATVRMADGAQWDAATGGVTTTGTGTARIAVEAGSSLETGRASLGTRAGNDAQVSVAGFGPGTLRASWEVIGDLTLGGDGTAALILGEGGSVRASGTAQLGNGSTLRLEGGHFEAASLSFAQGSQMEWASGTLRVTGAGGLRFDASTPAQASFLDPGRSLEVVGQFVIGHGATVRLAGGSLGVSSLALAGGTLTTARGHALALGLFPRIAGFGTLEGRYGHLPDHTLVAEGGVLTLIDTDPTRLAVDGNIEIASSGTLVIEEVDGATDLHGDVVIADGGRLRSVNGLRLVGSHILQGGAGSRIDGAFFNGRQVQGSRDAEQPLDFLGTVSGRGAFGGYVRFSGLYDPGESPAAVFLQNMSYASFATLRLEIGGYRSGTDHDFLWILEEASLDGTLEILFLDGFTPSAGDAFTMMSFGHRTGTFAHLSVAGLSPDLTASLVYGDRDLVLRIAAVPEPAEWAMLVAGLGLVLFARRRERGR